MKNKQAVLKIHGISVLIRSDNINFLNYLRNYFNCFIEDVISDSFDLEVLVNIKKGFSISPHYADSKITRKIGDRLGLLDSGEYGFSYREISGQIDFRFNNWTAQADFKKNIFKHFANKVFFRRKRMNDYYYRFIIRYLIQNLVFLKLRESQNLNISSGAAVSVDGKSYLFFGLPGSGKSTIVKKIKEHFGLRSEILTENFILSDSLGNNFIFPEGNKSPSAMSYPVAAGFITGHGQNMIINNINKRQAVDCIRLIDQYTAELPPQSFLSGYGLLNREFLSFLSLVEEGDLKSFDVFSLFVDNGATEFIKYFSDTYVSKQ